MARTPNIWYWKARKTWAVIIDGTRHLLGPNKKEAAQEFRRLMRQAREPQPQNGRSIGSHPSIPAILDSFLDFVKIERSPDTFEWYRYRLERFCRYLQNEHAHLRVEDLRPFHVQTWVNTYPHIRRTTRRNYLRSVKRALRWATKQGYLDHNPIEHLEVPAADRKEVCISHAEYEYMLSLIPDDALRDLVIVTWETGCRPQESLRVQAANFDANHQRWVFKARESKGEKIPRVVYLTDQALHITRKLMLKHPEGPLFRNSRGTPWTSDAVNCAVDRIQRRMGKDVMQREGKFISDEQISAFIPKLKQTRTTKGVERPKTKAELRKEAKEKLTNRLAATLAPRYSLYAIRHSWATHALERGVDTTTVSMLMGHNGDPSMLAKVYQHLNHNPQYMLEQAKKAVARA